MVKELFKGSVLFGPVPAVLVTTVDGNGKPNVFTVGWTGVACSRPPMVTIAVKKERLSYTNIIESGEFVINLTTKKMLKIIDFCGCRSGRKVDKIKHFDLDLEEGTDVSVPSLEQSPVALECKVRSVTELGTHDLFLAEIVRNKVDPSIIDTTGKFDLAKAGLVAYCHGEYFSLGRHPLARFGHSVAKKSTRQATHARKFGNKEKK